MITNNTNNCDKCGRPLDGKGWIEISGWKICGICQFESSKNENIISCPGSKNNCYYDGILGYENF